MLLVVNKSDGTVSILDAATGKLRTTVAVEAGPHEVEVLADGKTAAVSSYGDQGRARPHGHASSTWPPRKIVSRIDIGPGSRPHGLKALPDGRLLVTAEGTRELVVVDPRAAKVTARIATGRDISHMVAASPDGRRAYVTSLAGGSVTVIDLVTGKVVKDIPTGKGAEGLDVTPDGREIWVANREANTITVIDVKTLAPVFTINATEFPDPREDHARRPPRGRDVHGLGRRRRLRHGHARPGRAHSDRPRRGRWGGDARRSRSASARARLRSACSSRPTAGARSCRPRTPTSSP